MEDDLWWKTTFHGRRPLIEDNLWWKMTSDGRWPLRRPLMKGDLWWKRTNDGRRPLTEDDLWWKMTLMEDDLWCKMTFDGRRSLMEDNLWWKMILPLCPRYRRCGNFLLNFKYRIQTSQLFIIILELSLLYQSLLTIGLTKMEFDTEDQVLFLIGLIDIF